MFEGLAQLEFSILDFIYLHLRCGFLDPVMAGFSYFAKNGAGWVAIALFLLFFRKTRTWGVIALCAMALGAVSGELILKNIICRPRPYVDYQAFHGEALPFVLNAGEENSYSFPSGHTCCSFASAAVYFKMDKRVGIPALAIACLVGFSRLYNYVHYPLDVLGGLLLGILCGLFTVWLFKKYKPEQKILRLGGKRYE